MSWYQFYALLSQVFLAAYFASRDMTGCLVVFGSLYLILSFVVGYAEHQLKK